MRFNKKLRRALPLSLAAMLAVTSVTPVAAHDGGPPPEERILLSEHTAADYEITGEGEAEGDAAADEHGHYVFSAADSDPEMFATDSEAREEESDAEILPEEPLPDESIPDGSDPAEDSDEAGREEEEESETVPDGGVQGPEQDMSETVPEDMDLEETEKDGAGEAVEEATPSDAIIGTAEPDESGAVHVEGRVWDLNGVPKENRKEYDERLRVYPESVSTNTGHYHDRVESRVLDDDGETFWETSQTNSADLHTYLDFTFGKEEAFSRLVYGCRNDTGGYRKGFAYECKIYVSESGEEDDLHLAVIGTFDVETTDFIAYTFPEQTAKLVRFEFVRSKDNFPSARDIYFYSEDTEEEAMDNLFTDYAMFRLADEYANEDAIDSLEKKVRDNPLYETVFKKKLDRARKILSGELSFNEDLELSTSKTAKHRIERYGNVVDYARKKLLYNSYGTNRQATGIAAYGNTTITVYVEAEDGDPLPKIQFSQAYGHWTRWLHTEQQLVRGVNTFKVPDLRNGNYKTSAVPAAGTVYIVNPYTENEQSENVKVYMEGCDTYPLFRKGDDEEAFKKTLSDYADRVRENPTEVIDLTELVCDHAIMTVTATRADEIYATESPQKNLEYWDTVLHETLAFEGVQFEEGEDYYDERCEHLNINYRVSQEWSGGWMFAHTEHIGLYADAESCLIDSLDEDGNSNISWGFIHEMGHMTDLPARTIGETTNNMPANFNNAYFRNEVRNPEYYELANAMSSDRDTVKNTFQQQRYNYIIFFLLESYFPGQWGRTDNMYRYEDKGQYEGMTPTEKQVFMTSLACKTDLGYYFTRWGYSLRAEEAPFDEKTASDTYKNAMQQAIRDGKIEENKLPIWYLDPPQYKWMRDKGDVETQKGALYDEDDTTQITRVLKTGNGYSLTMPPISDEAHLGYEIWEGDGDSMTRIGFTNSAGFTDTYPYQKGYEPTYRVCAYDRLLNHTALSEPKKAVSDSEVCEVKGTVYNSIQEGIRAAGAGGTVLLLKDTADSGITVPYKVTVTTKDRDVTISRGGDGPIFKLTSGSELILQPADGHTITLEGAKIRQSHALVEAEGNGKYTITGVTFRDSISTKDGGAIANLTAQVRGTVNNCRFENNRAEKNGGAVYNNGTVTLTGCTFTGNVSDIGGGAFCNEKGGVATVADCTLDGNSAAKGGALFGDGLTTVTGGSFANNNAAYGGAICFAPTANAHSRKLSVDKGTAFTGNTAVRGGALYVTNGGNVTIAQASVRKNNEPAEITPAFMEILNDPAKIGITPLRIDEAAAGAAAEETAVDADTISAASISAEPPRDAEEEKVPYDICLNNGNLTLNGQTATFDADLYKDGSLACLTAIPAKGSLRIALCEYTTAQPVVTTNFTVTAEDLNRITLADGSYELAEGADHKSIYLKAGNSVTLHENGGTIKSGGITGYIIGTRTKLPTEVVKPGHTFAGWYEDPNFDGHSVKYIEATETGNKDYYAKWIVTKHMVVYETGGGTIRDEGRKLFTYEDAFTLPSDLVYDDHIFVGWHEKSDFSDGIVTEVKAGTDRKLTFYAEWKHLKTETEQKVIEEASCTEGGSYKEIVTCPICKTKLSERIVETDPAGHAFDEWVYDREPDCVNGGERTHVCSVCGFSETQDVGPNGHTWSEQYTVETEPTCTTEGSEYTVCTVCGERGPSRAIARTEHIPGETHRLNEVPATCTEEGSYTEAVLCKTCGHKISEKGVTVPPTEHEYGDWKETLPATCTEKGIAERRCKKCDHAETKEIEANGHSWSKEFTEDVPATCEQDGVESVKCTVCGASGESRPITRLGHTEGEPQRLNEIPATCTEEGSYTETVFCETCGKKLSETVIPIPAEDHVFGAWEEVHSPTCVADGAMERRCEKCGYTETKNLDQNGHTWSENYTVDVYPTCTSEGSESVKCTVCGVSGASRVMERLEHTASEPKYIDRVPATCTEDGSYKKVIECTVCGEMLSEEIIRIPAEGHRFGEWKEIRSATCTESGMAEHWCEKCDYAETKETDPKGHVWSDEYTEDAPATCITEGIESRKCTVCGERGDSRTVERVAHQPGEPVRTHETKASCTEDGFYTRTVSCTFCGEELSMDDVTVPATGHDYGPWKETKAPTCTESGAKERKCANCGDTETEETKPNGHTWSEDYTVDVPPTCVTDGSKSLKCTVCGEKGASEVIGKLGHTRGEPQYLDEVPATCTENGSYTEIVSCTVCGAELSRQLYTTEAEGHVFGEWEELEAPSCTAKGTMVRHCTVCGFTESDELDEKGHDWEDEYRIDREPDCVTEGSRSIHCKRCDAVLKSEVLPAKGHVYKDGKCVVCGEPELSDEHYESPKDDPEEPNEPSDPSGGNGETNGGTDKPGDSTDPGEGNDPNANDGQNGGEQKDPPSEQTGSGKGGTSGGYSGYPGSLGKDGQNEKPTAAGTERETAGNGTQATDPGRTSGGSSAANGASGETGGSKSGTGSRTEQKPGKGGVDGNTGTLSAETTAASGSDRSPGQTSARESAAETEAASKETTKSPTSEVTVKETVKDKEAESTEETTEAEETGNGSVRNAIVAVVCLFAALLIIIVSYYLSKRKNREKDF